MVRVSTSINKTLQILFLFIVFSFPGTPPRPLFILQETKNSVKCRPGVTAFAASP
jgi:hypothetical protein